MVDVYLALDPSEKRRVVLKIVERSHDPFTLTVIDAEKRGAAIQQQLHSIDSRILEVYEYGEQDGCFFVAMQYAEGRSIAEILGTQTRLDARRAAAYAAEALSQLANLHSFQAEIDGQKRAVVHGDIKPSNIQIGPAGEVWLLDFGIAKAITLTRHLTSHNLGSPGYCSPERIRTAKVDPHADLWALGVSLYEMVAGLPPYQAQSTRKLEDLIQSRRPPRALPADCPAPLKAIISRALAGEIDYRYETAGKFEQDLRMFLEGQPTVAEAGPQPSWVANETLQKSTPDPEPGRGTRLRRIENWIGQFQRVLFGFAAGLLVFLPVAYFVRGWLEARPLRTPHDYTRTGTSAMVEDVQLYSKLRERYRVLGRLSPVDGFDGTLRASLMAAGNAVLGRYRNSSDPALDHFDWTKARGCFAQVLALEPGNADALAGQAICDGNLQLASDAASAGAKTSFEQAVLYKTDLPDPHLGLARFYVYGQHNIGQAIAEFRIAERLGYRAGPREAEQQADGFLNRAELEMQLWTGAKSKALQARYLARNQRDFERARNLYEPISGFSNVDRALERLDKDQEVQRQVLAQRAEAARRAQRAQTLARYHRWR